MRIDGIGLGDYIDFAFLSAQLVHYPSIALMVTFAATGFSSNPQEIWFRITDLQDFIHQLETLEHLRQGEAKLLQMSEPSEYTPLRFRIFSTDRTGQMAISVEAVRTDYSVYNLGLVANKLSVIFAIDSYILSTVLADFRALVNDYQF